MCALASPIGSASNESEVEMCLWKVVEAVEPGLVSRVQATLALLICRLDPL